MAPRTLVLLHAFPVGTGMWQPQHGAFAGWRVIVPSFPGFDGVPPLGVPSLEGFADHVILELDRAGVEAAVIGGVSMGGYVAFALLRRARSRVAGLILADTRSGADTEDAKAGRRRMLETIARDGVAPIAADMLPKLLGRTTLASRPDLVAQVASMIERQTAAGVAGAVEAIMGRPDSTPLLAEIAVPTLVMVGDEDAITPPAEAERLHQAITGSRYARIPGAGHLSNLEQPGAFNAAIETFLRADC